jgi:hypothetical protein
MQINKLMAPHQNHVVPYFHSNVFTHPLGSDARKKYSYIHEVRNTVQIGNPETTAQHDIELYGFSKCPVPVFIVRQTLRHKAQRRCINIPYTKWYVSCHIPLEHVFLVSMVTYLR